MEENPVSVRLRLIPYNARLLDERKARGWTQKTMSLLTGISSGHLGHIETLRLVPSENAMDEICAALDLPREYLFPQSLIEAIREGLFGQRVAELEEQQVIRLTEARRARMLPPVTEEEGLQAADRYLLKQAVADILTELKPREQKVLSLRFGLQDGRSHTLEHVGRELGFTRERIRQIEAKALRKLRHPRLSKKLLDFLW